MAEDAGLGPLQLGICAMEKKATSKPMKTILSLLSKFGDIEVVPFPESMILNEPVENWPAPVDCLISFFSDGFPLDKAEAYVALRQPHCVNDLTAQRILLDRRRVYALLEENGIPHPQATVVERDAEGNFVGPAAECFDEGDDFIVVGGTKITKPFVEKPVDAEDHNICIYYPSGAGGGVKKLFRKVGDRSSSFDPSVRHVRTDGTYMYEPFMKTQGTDIKVYTVGPEYAHAEARKSPVIDGVVNRNEDGKEIRYPVVLTPREKEMARRVCLAFGQMVCGFDLLRTATGSYVIDVNGWSFVKGLPKYYEDAAALLRKYILSVSGRSTLLSIKRVDSLVNCSDSPLQDSQDGQQEHEELPERTRSDRWEHEELLAVLAVMRHGDRTPKNKMKLTTQRKEFLDLHRRWASGPRKEVKLKAPKQLQEVLDLAYAIVGHDETDGADGRPLDPGAAAAAEPPAGAPTAACPESVAAEPLDEKTEEAVRLIRAVLASGGNFDGIYRKVQIKPLAWTSPAAGGPEEVREVLVILKYGGILTPIGVQQAEELGQSFRGEMYPGESADAQAGAYSTGLLRLHATQRHDFKVYSSDEGRVQMSAAAFARGLLDLEKGALTPICVALVETDSQMLDDLPSSARPLMQDSKQSLYEKITGSWVQPDRSPTSSPSSPPKARPPSLYRLWSQGSEDLPSDRIPVMLDAFEELRERMNKLCQEMGNLDGQYCSESTKPLLVRKRWRKLTEDIWDKKTNSWNLSKFPEIYDAAKFDMIHHPKLLPGMKELYAVAKRINDVIVPHEYGSDVPSRARIGSVVCGKLLRKLLVDLSNTMSVEAQPDLPSWKLTTALQYLRRFLPSLPGTVREGSDDQPPHTPESEADEDLKEAEFAGLDARMAHKLKSPHRRVRTRLYFTSESHIQTLMNVLRYCHTRSARRLDTTGSASDDAASSDGSPSKAEADPIVCPEVEQRLQDQPIFDYLTQIVFRLYEDKRCPENTPERFRVEVLFSPGASSDPASDPPGDKKSPLDCLQPLHAPDRPLTYERLKELLSPFANGISKSARPDCPTEGTTPKGALGFREQSSMMSPP